MSDTFDHEGDAWDDYERRHEGVESGWYRLTARGSHSRDPLYYHTKVKFVCMVSTTAKAVRLELPDGRLVWLPRSVCREWGEGVVWVHGKTLKMSLKTAEQKVDPQSLLGDLPDGWNELQDDPNPPF